MRALVVYESMYGNTRQIAEAIATGLGCAAVPVKDATGDRLVDAELVVIGGPTHMFGMSRPSSRRSAVTAAAKPGSGLTVEPDAAGPGVREWLAEHARELRSAAVFDTRIKLPVPLGGRASRRIAGVLRRNRVRLAAAPQSFLVDKANHLLPGELDRAAAWGRRLAEHVSAA